MSEPHKFAIQLADESVVVGYVVGEYGGHLLPRHGGYGRIRLAIANAEAGFPTGLVEPAPGCATVLADGDLRPVVVPLRGAEVLT